MSLPELLSNKRQQERLTAAIKKGGIIIYPTDTVYGIGCDATNRIAVDRVRQIKQTSHPFSVIALSKEWIRDHFVLRHPAYLDKLPGPYTLILKMKQSVVAGNVSGKPTLGVRIPDHPVTTLLQTSRVPIVTTSCNRSGQTPIRTIEELSQEFKGVDVLINGGQLGQNPSTIIDLTEKEPKHIR